MPEKAASVNLEELILEGYEREAVLVRRIDMAQAEIERLRRVMREVADELDSIAWSMNTSACDSSIKRLRDAR